MSDTSSQTKDKTGLLSRSLLLVCILLFANQVNAQSAETSRILQRLTHERQMVTDQLDQFSKTLDLLRTDGEALEQSSNPAIKTLVLESVALKERLIAITEQEVTLLQEQIIAAKSSENSTSDEETLASIEPKPDDALESKPLRTHNVDYTQEKEAENVQRLHHLLENYYLELQESARILPTEEEIALREMAQLDAETLDKIPFSVDKVRLNGSEGSTALAEITQRLMDPNLPESRRDIAPICLIKTRLFDTLVGSENRSLMPVGKNHYIARVRLQPGITSLTILTNEWEVQLPQHANASDFLITLYRPVDGTPELHVFAIDDLLAVDRPHIPAWLPEDLKITKRAG